MDRLELGYDALHAADPSLIMLDYRVGAGEGAALPGYSFR